MKTATTNGSRARTKDPMDLLREDFSALKQDLTALVGNRFSAVSDCTKETLSKAAEETRKRAEVMHKGIRNAAASRPLTTIALAVAAGAVGAKLLGWMMRR